MIESREFSMKIKNQKGFTLIELLAVIVVLAIIMIFAIPSVMTAMNNAKKGAFKTYAQKILNAAQAQYQSEVLMGTATSSMCYTIAPHASASPTGTQKGNGALMTTSGNYKGKVDITAPSGEDPTFKLTMTDNSYNVDEVEYSDLDDSDNIATGTKATVVNDCTKP